MKLSEKSRALPKAFEEVEKRLPLVREIIENAEKSLRNAQVTDADKQILEHSYDKALNLQVILDEMEQECQKDQDTKDWSKLRTIYYKALRGIKASRVEHLMKEILEDIKKLALNHVFKLSGKDDIKRLEEAIHDLSRGRTISSRF